MSFENLADLFPITKECIYLNHAGLSPLSTKSKDAMMNAIEWAVAGTFKQYEWKEHYDRTRRKISELIHCQPQDIAFTRSTSDGISMLVNGLDWTPQDNVVTYVGEHPTVRLNCERISREFGVEVRVAGQRSGAPDTDELLSLIDDQTKAVLISWVQYSTGFRSALRPIGLCCRNHRALFMVDAVQGLGALELNVGREYVDACAAGAQKFLMGPEGIGFMFVSGRALEKMTPSIVGWRSVKGHESLSAEAVAYNDGALRFEYGTQNLAGVCGLDASLDLFNSLRPNAIERYLLDLTSYLATRLEAKGYQVSIPGERLSAIVSCSHKNKTGSELESLLRAKRIETSSRIGRLRVSPHVYNTREDIDELLRALPD